MSERELNVFNLTPEGIAELPPTELAPGRAEFPYHWDSDEYVSRRQLLQFAVYTSGALFVSTAFLALLGWATQREATAVTPQQIATVSQVPEGKAFYFHYPGAADQAVLLHLSGDRYVAYSQRCTHLSCAVYFQADRNRLACPCHEGVFDPQTGEPIAGPPQRALTRITLRREGDTLLAVGQEP